MSSFTPQPYPENPSITRYFSGGLVPYRFVALKPPEDDADSSHDDRYHYSFDVLPGMDLVLWRGRCYGRRRPHDLHPHLVFRDQMDNNGNEVKAREGKQQLSTNSRLAYTISVLGGNVQFQPYHGYESDPSYTRGDSDEYAEMKMIFFFGCQRYLYYHSLTETVLPLLQRRARRRLQYLAATRAKLAVFFMQRLTTCSNYLDIDSGDSKMTTLPAEIMDIIGALALGKAQSKAAATSRDAHSHGPGLVVESDNFKQLMLTRAQSRVALNLKF